MSLSAERPIQITFSTAKEISDEILGATINFCEETGYIQNVRMFTFLWSAFLFSAKDEVCENGILKDVLGAYTWSLSRVFPKLSEDCAFRTEVGKLCQFYWNKLSSDFEHIKTEAEISMLLGIANGLHSRDNPNSPLSLNGNPLKKFAQVSTVIQSNIYSTLRKINNDMNIQYKYVLDSAGFSGFSQVPNVVTQENYKPNQKTVPTSTPTTNSQPLGMGWYKFLINFGLFVGSFFNFIYGIAYLTGGIYEVQSDGFITAEDVYYYFDNIQLFDIMYGLLLIGLSVFGIVLRFKLAQYKLDAPRLVYIFYGIATGGVCLYSFCSWTIMYATLVFSDFLPIIGSATIFFLNYKYFSNRAHMFVN